MERSGVEPSELLVEVNESIRELAARSDREGSLDWEFVCECGDPACDARVALSLASYDATRTAKRPVLAPVHLHEEADTAGARPFVLRDDGLSVAAHGRPRPDGRKAG
jgi:hypothetical protein